MATDVNGGCWIVGKCGNECSSRYLNCLDCCRTEQGEVQRGTKSKPLTHCGAKGQARELTVTHHGPVPTPDPRLDCPLS